MRNLKFYFDIEIFSQYKVSDLVGGRGLHGSDFLARAGLARMATISARPEVKKKNFGPGPAQPEREIKI